jgi:hypothetical protein
MLSVCILSIVALIFPIVYLAGYGSAQFSSIHSILGILLLVWMLLQTGLGEYIHLKFDAQRTKKPVRNEVHVWSGRILAALSYVVLLLGVAQYTTVKFASSASGLYVPLMCTVGVLVPLIYAAGLLGGLSWRKNKVNNSKAVEVDGLKQSSSQVELVASVDTAFSTTLNEQGPVEQRKGYVKSDSTEFVKPNYLQDVENSFATSDMSVGSDVGLLSKV